MFVTCEHCGHMGSGPPQDIIDFAERHTLDTGHTTHVKGTFVETPDHKQQRIADGLLALEKGVPA